MIEMRKKSSKLSTVFAFSGTKESKSIIFHNFLVFMLVKITFLYKQLKNCRSVREFQNSREVRTHENTRLTDRVCTKCLQFSRHLKYREYSRRFVLCCFVITLKWSLLKQQDLDTVIVTKVSMFTFIEQYFSVATRVLLSKVSL